jgi:Flp pilus assembly protein TadD
VAQYAYAASLRPDDAEVLEMLAQAYAAAGDVEDAVNTAAKAITVAEAAGDKALADRVRAQYAR